MSLKLIALSGVSWGALHRALPPIDVAYVALTSGRALGLVRFR